VVTTYSSRDKPYFLKNNGGWQLLSEQSERGGWNTVNCLVWGLLKIATALKIEPLNDIFKLRCVLLNNGTVKFIRTKEELYNLRWK